MIFESKNFPWKSKYIYNNRLELIEVDEKEIVSVEEGATIVSSPICTKYV